MEQDIVKKTIESLMKDRHVKQILTDTFFQSKSVEELCEKFSIPMAICSQKVRALERLGMLVCDHSFRFKNDTKVKYYRSDLLNTHFIFKPDDLYLRFEILPKIPHNYPRWLTVRLS